MEKIHFFFLNLCFYLLGDKIVLFTYFPQKFYIDSLLDANKTAGEEARRQLHKNAASNLEQVLAATPHKTPTVRPPASYHENYSS